MWGEGTYVLGCSSAVEHFCNICEALGSFASTRKSTWCYSWRKTTGGLPLGAVSCPRPLSLLPVPHEVSCFAHCMPLPWWPCITDGAKWSLTDTSETRDPKKPFLLQILPLCSLSWWWKNCQAVFILTITTVFSMWFSFQSTFVWLVMSHSDFSFIYFLNMYGGVIGACHNLCGGQKINWELFLFHHAGSRNQGLTTSTFTLYRHSGGWGKRMEMGVRPLWAT